VEALEIKHELNDPFHMPSMEEVVGQITGKTMYRRNATEAFQDFNREAVSKILNQLSQDGASEVAVHMLCPKCENPVETGLARIEEESERDFKRTSQKYQLGRKFRRFLDSKTDEVSLERIKDYKPFAYHHKCVNALKASCALQALAAITFLQRTNGGASIENIQDAIKDLHPSWGAEIIRLIDEKLDEVTFPSDVGDSEITAEVISALIKIAKGFHNNLAPWITNIFTSQLRYAPNKGWIFEGKDEASPFPKNRTFDRRHKANTRTVTDTEIIVGEEHETERSAVA